MSLISEVGGQIKFKASLVHMESFILVWTYTVKLCVEKIKIEDFEHHQHEVVI